MQELPCAICGDSVAYKIKYRQHLNDDEVDFAARKTPRHVHFRIVECTRCGLIYSSPIYSEGKIIQLYRESRFIEEVQLHNMLRDYLEHFQSALKLLDRAERMLEIGCSSGFFLNAAKKHGIPIVMGVEPGIDALGKASPEIRPCIVNDVFHKGLFEEEYFDIVCVFQVMDHIVDPNVFLQNIYRVLRRGGILLTINHNVRSWLPKVLGRYCPMYDIEHIYLFDLSTMRKILEKHQFETVVIRNITSSYGLLYALKMFPMVSSFKDVLKRLVELKQFQSFRIRLHAGNMLSIARKGHV